MRSWRTRAASLLIALVLLLPRSAPASHGASPELIIIPATPQTLVVPASTLIHTLGADFFHEDDGTVYVQTGDIPAMWLRDSSAQTKPYVRFADHYPKLKLLVRAVIERNAKNVLTDPYANAFTSGFKIWEEKWEVDSLDYPITLAYTYWRRTGDRALFTTRLHWALEHTVKTLRCEQHHASCSHYTSRYLNNRGHGPDFEDTGMIWTAFRPSDDPVRFPFNIPQQMFTVVAMHELQELATDGYGDARLAADASSLAAQVQSGIEHYGLVYHPRYGWIYAYEVDGLGNAHLMDDANLPNLLSAAYYGYASRGNPFYENTRNFVLSPANPYYYTGTYAAGLGSPHAPTGWVWPLGIISAGLTSRLPVRTLDAISQITHTQLSEGLMHESFDPNDPTRFTRASFGWADAMYGELVFRAAAGFDADPLPQIVETGAGYGVPQQTPIIVAAPQLWYNYATVYVALDHLLQE